MLSDILPTGFECGVLNGKVKPGDTIAIVGAGPVGLAALMTAQFYSPAGIISIDLDDNRLQVAQELRRHRLLINSADGNAIQRVMELTHGEGVDVAIEAVGMPATFDICQGILAAGGHLANIGVHGKPVLLHMEKLWDRNATLTTRLVDTVTTPMLIKAVRIGQTAARQAGDAPLRLRRHPESLRHLRQRRETFRSESSIGKPRAIIFAMKKREDESTRSYATVSGKEKGLGPDSAGQSGDTQGLSEVAGADSESVSELVEEGQFLRSRCRSVASKTHPTAT